MSTQAVRRLERVALTLIVVPATFWVLLSLVVARHVEFTNVHFGFDGVDPPVALLTGFVDLLCFCTLMWQVKQVLRRARSERQLLQSIPTLLGRIGRLVVIWPLADLLAGNLSGILDLWHGRDPKFALELSFHFSLMAVGVVLLVVRPLVERMQRVHDEMRLVV